MATTEEPQSDAEYIKLVNEIRKSPARLEMLNKFMSTSERSTTGKLIWPEALDLVFKKRQQPESFCNEFYCLAGMACRLHSQKYRDSDNAGVRKHIDIMLGSGRPGRK